ncbi:MAG: glutathione peroxidase [Clostridiales bacterium]|nr:glutathione peroxidase [Clostridiales bacterium]
MKNVYDFSVEDIRGAEVSLDQYKGKVLLIVNTATQCGFTPQYDILQDLYEKHQGEGFEILDFPCNQFGNQAPGSNEEIASFCDMHYGITFPRFSKVDVNGENAIPLYKYLIEQKCFQGFNPENEMTPRLEGVLLKTNPNYKNEPDIKWNFTKFLIDREGRVLERFEPTEDMSYVEEKIAEALQKSDESSSGQ